MLLGPGHIGIVNWLVDGIKKQADNLDHSSEPTAMRNAQKESRPKHT